MMVWVCMAATGVRNLEFIDWKVDVEYYKAVLISEMLPSAAQWVGKKYILQWNNE